MKTETLHTLIVAKTLFEQVQQIASAENEHHASAALLLLQDAVELVLLASLFELEVDQQKNIEGFSFDQLIGELRAAGITVPKSGTLKAMNKSRVIVKHYGQMAEPNTVRNYLDSSILAVDLILKQVVNIDMQSIMLHHLIPDGESKSFLSEAATQIDDGDFLSALTSIRKALFVEIEIDYVIEEWENDDDMNLLSFLVKKGSKALYYTKNKDWIQKNVKEPFDYIQIDHERMRLDLLEWGVNTQDYWNLWRMTPAIYRKIGEQTWFTRLEIDRPEADKDTALYCLDRAVSLISKKKAHGSSARFYERGHQPFFLIQAYRQTSVFASSDSQSTVIEMFDKGDVTNAESFLMGLDGKKYFRIVDRHRPNHRILMGYTLCQDWERHEEAAEDNEEATQGILELGVDGNQNTEIAGSSRPSRRINSAGLEQSDG